MKKTRYQYTKEQKERILYEISLNKTIDDAFISIGLDVNKLDVNDEKYKAKLVSKWKKELYSNRENISFLNRNHQLIQLEKEINKNEDDLISEYYLKDAKNVDNTLY